MGIAKKSLNSLLHVIRRILNFFMKNSKNREEELPDCVTEFVAKERKKVLQVTLPEKISLTPRVK